MNEGEAMGMEGPGLVEKGPEPIKQLPEVRFNVPESSSPSRPKRGRPPPMKLKNEEERQQQGHDATATDEAEQGIVLTAVFTPDTPFVDDPLWGRFYLPRGRFGIRPFLSFLLCPCYHGRLKSCQELLCCCCSSTPTLPPLDEEGEARERKELVCRYLTSIATWIMVAQAVMLGVAMEVVVVPLRINWLIGPSAKTLVALGAKDTKLIVHGHEGFRLFSSLFLYAGLIQLVAMIPLVSRIGVFLEYHWGKLQWLSIYVLSGVFGMAISTMTTPDMVTVGGATGLAGIMGAWLMDLGLRLVDQRRGAHSERKEPGQQVKVELIMWAVDYAFLFFCSFSIFNDPMATIGATGFGFLLGLPLFMHHRPTWKAVALRTVAAVVAVVVFTVTIIHVFRGYMVPLVTGPLQTPTKPHSQ